MTATETTNAIGLDTHKSAELISSLNELLSNYQVYYMNVRGFHWNIKGDKFFELHVKFEELYNDLELKIDEVAERILMLGGTPLHTFGDYMEISSIAPAKNVSEARAAVQSILDGFKTLLLKQRSLLELSGNADDEGTNSLMSDYVREQEKLIWMYSSFMKD
ncbi:DNA starvation/stationary phase protection protein [Crocinitomicaceae bacterium]|nr:DNA starvation/stationary phase protection protein [Crocinitomicaceae bacterium]MDC0257751.1 DNA starvation/stationary phase protection protein [Crocinitomicaceae bacterium]